MSAQSSHPDGPGARPGTPAPDSEEPELASEESVPSDGKDEEGEQMIEELGRERREKDR